LTIRVLIADDQALVRAGFTMILDAEDDIDVVGEASDGREALREVQRLQPHVVLMDIRMPELDGIEATRQLTAGETDGGPRVLMLTTFDLDEYVYEARCAPARAGSCSRTRRRSSSSRRSGSSRAARRCSPRS
jgi:DNA-binding NarL/FixJ family response regulator